MSEIMTALRECSAKRRVRIAVVGDVIRDRFVSCEYGPVCQEGVPVLINGDVVEVPGGAGNVIRQLRHWNATTHLVGLVDEPTEQLLIRHGIDCEYSAGLLNGSNPIKRRSYVGGRMVLRQDTERLNYGEATSNLNAGRTAIADDLQKLLAEGLDIVLISDYRKGVFDSVSLQQIISRCHDARVPVVVDPKGHPLDYMGCSVLKPNARWLRGHGGPFPFPGNLAYFRDKVFCDALVCTRGASSPHGFEGLSKTFVCSERPPVPVQSIVGAGDCFAALLTFAAAHRFDVPDAAEIAHAAGRCYVQHPFNRPVTPHEVHSDLDPTGAKIVTWDQLSAALRILHPDGKIIFANGCFDLLHAGHCHTLEWARRQGDCLVVAVNSDASVAKLKGEGRPVVPERDRVRQLAALSCVDFVTAFYGDTPSELLDRLPPVHLVKGPEWAARASQIPCLLHPNVCGVLIAPPSPHPDHTSDLIRRLKENTVVRPD